VQGLDEEGLYRISGVAMAVDDLKAEFEKSLCPRQMLMICSCYVIWLVV